MNIVTDDLFSIKFAKTIMGVSSEFRDSDDN